MKFPIALVLKGLAVMILFSGMLILKFGWLFGLIAFAASGLALLIMTGALGHIILWIKNKIQN
jgi:hypothetical protein